MYELFPWQVYGFAPYKSDRGQQYSLQNVSGLRVRPPTQPADESSRAHWTRPRSVGPPLFGPHFL